MPERLSTEKLLSHPDVMRVIHKVNPEFVERTAYRPPVCDVFKAPATELLIDDAYRFEIDRDSRAQLSQIIENKVQRIVGKDDPGSQRHVAEERVAAVEPGGEGVGVDAVDRFIV